MHMPWFRAYPIIYIIQWAVETRLLPLTGLLETMKAQQKVQRSTTTVTMALFLEERWWPHVGQMGHGVQTPLNWSVWKHLQVWLLFKLQECDIMIIYPYLQVTVDLQSSHQMHLWRITMTLWRGLWWSTAVILVSFQRESSDQFVEMILTPGILTLPVWCAGKQVLLVSTFTKDITLCVVRVYLMFPATCIFTSSTVPFTLTAWCYVFKIGLT